MTHVMKYDYEGSFMHVYNNCH